MVFSVKVLFSYFATLLLNIDCNLFLGKCNFQNGLCTWYNLPNSQGDDFDWIRGSGGTPSSLTGPRSDRKGDRNGKKITKFQFE